jgi:hypothetical protein
LRTLSWFVSYRRLSSQFQFSLSPVTLEYLSQWRAHSLAWYPLYIRTLWCVQICAAYVKFLKNTTPALRRYMQSKQKRKSHYLHLFEKAIFACRVAVGRIYCTYCQLSDMQGYQNTIGVVNTNQWRNLIVLLTVFDPASLTTKSTNRMSPVNVPEQSVPDPR